MKSKFTINFRSFTHQSFMLLIFFIGIVSVFSVLYSAPKLKMPEENDDCMMCHEDKSLRGKVRGKNMSVFVNTETVLKSVHAQVKCIDCHTDLEGVDLPHDDDLKPVNCNKCHADEQKDYNISMHGASHKRGDPLAPTCRSCHGAHNIVPVKSKDSPVSPLKIPAICGQCHKEGTSVQLMRNIPQSHILENYSESIHGEGLFKKGLIVSATCASCHTPHLILPHTDKRSSIARENIASTCAKCHAQIEEVHKKVIDGKLWEKESHVLPACVDCHQPHKIRKTFYDLGLSNQECLNCHTKQNIKASDDGRSLFADGSKIEHSVHNELACSQCHTEVRPSKDRSCSTITTKVNCGSCHDNINSKYVKSSHGKFNSIGDKNAPYCTTCHGDHEVLKKTDPKSPIFSVNILKLCSQCHKDGEKAAVRLKGKAQHLVEHYTESVHGKGMSKGTLTVTANCSDCHTAHSEINHQDTSASTNKKNISQTCGKCHWGIGTEFENSIHGASNAGKGKNLPSCDNCHPAHSIIDPTKDEFRFSILTTCGKCHEKISHSYFDTYHGKASLLGSARAAKCQDCHSAHSILPQSNPHSSLSKQNIMKTCSKCHPRANKGFTRYLTHATHHDSAKYPLLFITFWGMTFLLLGTFIISWLHTLLWLPKSLKMRKHLKSLKTESHSGIRVARFTKFERVLHVIMILSFLMLALTGMLLKFSYTGWALFIVKLLGGVETAGFIHRFASTMLFGVFISHIYDLVRKKRTYFKSWKDMLLGKDSMLPNRKDWQDFTGSIKWFIGKGPRPQYGRWTYWEKFDYFAVFWGIFVIGSTGLTLWFPSIFTFFLPGELINVATIIHSDEALLAAGFIFTIHFFNTHFRPEKFPMDTVIFSGSYHLEEFKFDRPDEYKDVMEEGNIETMYAPEPSLKFKKAFTIFGWSALTIGLIIVFLIIISIFDLYF